MARGMVTAIAFSLPELTCGMPVEMAPKMRSTLHDIASVTAWPNPLYGTCTRSMSAEALSISPTMCWLLPKPEVA